MSRMIQSGFVVGGVGLLVVLQLFNSVQLNNLEEQVIANQKKLEKLEKGGIQIAAGAAVANTGTAAAASSCEDVAGSILKCPTRPRAKAAHIEPGQVFHYKIAQDPRGLNPYVANGADVSEYTLYINEQLAERDFDDPSIFNPELAEWAKTDDNLTFRIKLKEGVWWHLPTVDWDSGKYDWLKGEGPGGRHELTADDVIFALDIIKNTQTSGRVSSLRNYFEPLESYRQLDRYTLEITFSEVLYTNLGSILELWPMPRWLYMYDEQGQRFDEATWGLKFNEHWYNQKAIGTGPYVFDAWEPGVKLELVANDHYWNDSTGNGPTFARIIMPVVRDQQAWVRKLKAGEIDMTQIQPEQYNTEVKSVRDKGGTVFLGNEHIQYVEHDTLGYFYLGWNEDKPMFGDKRVRQAMSLALNRQGLVDNVFHGLGVVNSGPFAMQQPCYDKSIEPWPFDLEMAKQKLDEAGWTDTDGDGIRDKVIDGEKVDFKFTMLIYGGSNEYNTLADVYREDLLSIGVQMTPSAVEWSTMLKKMDEREFDVYTGAWVLSWDTDLMQIWHSKEADRPQSSNRIGFRNPEADRIAETLRKTLDEDERTALCHQFHALVHEEQPYTFIYQRRRPVLYWDHMNPPEFQKVYPYRDLRRFSFASEPSY